MPTPQISPMPRHLLEVVAIILAAERPVTRYDVRRFLKRADLHSLVTSYWLTWDLEYRPTRYQLNLDRPGMAEAIALVEIQTGLSSEPYRATMAASRREPIHSDHFAPAPPAEADEVAQSHPVDPLAPDAAHQLQEMADRVNLASIGMDRESIGGYLVAHRIASPTPLPEYARDLCRTLDQITHAVASLETSCRHVHDPAAHQWADVLQELRGHLLSSPEEAPYDPGRRLVRVLLFAQHNAAAMRLFAARLNAPEQTDTPALAQLLGQLLLEHAAELHAVAQRAGSLANPWYNNAEHHCLRLALTHDAGQRPTSEPEAMA